MNTDNEKKYLPIDQAFAGFILRLAGRENDAVLEQVSLELSQAVRSGASCLLISDELRDHLLENCAKAVGVYPHNRSSLPLMLSGNHLYFQKLLKFEQQLAERCMSVARQQVPELPADTVDEIFSSLPPSPAVDAQKAAVRRALGKPLAIICGGPGTGKTTVASALLAQELQRTPPHRIALLAPTGKAHVRLKESLLEDSKKFNIPSGIRASFEQLPGGTIHRFLEWGQYGPKYNANVPLPCDLILVDECSMISLHLMTSLLAAIPANDARVVLLGDDAQLASIDAGLVFSDLCQAALECPTGPLNGIVSNLIFNFRAKSAPELIRLAENLRAGYLPENFSISPVPQLKSFARTFPDCVAAAAKIHELCKKHTGERLKDAFTLLDEYKIICPVNLNVPYGTAGVNNAIMSALDLTETSPGIPIMIRHNNYDLQLFNGDTGLLIPGKKAVFPGRNEAFPLPILPEYDIAYAITAHKSQGSGYQNIILLLPEEEHPLVNRPLIYTAVTRARKSAAIYGNRKIIEDALKMTGSRASGLKNRLLALNGDQS